MVRKPGPRTMRWAIQGPPPLRDGIRVDSAPGTRLVTSPHTCCSLLKDFNFNTFLLCFSFSFPSTLNALSKNQVGEESGRPVLHITFSSDTGFGRDPKQDHMTRPHETQTPLSYPHSGQSAGQSSPDPSKPQAFCGEKGENVAFPSGEAGTLLGERQAKLAARDGACCLLYLSSAQTACQTRSELDSSAKARGLLAPWKPAPLGVNGHLRGTGHTSLPWAHPHDGLHHGNQESRFCHRRRVGAEPPLGPGPPWERQRDGIFLEQ